MKAIHKRQKVRLLIKVSGWPPPTLYPSLPLVQKLYAQRRQTRKAKEAAEAETARRHQDDMHYQTFIGIVEGLFRGMS